MIRALAVLLTGATMAAADEPPAVVPPAYLAPQWRLVALNGEPVGTRVTIDLSQPGQVSGNAPCNRYAGRYDGTLPDFRPGPLRVTRRACPDLALEQAFFQALAAVTRAETTADRLVLTGDGMRLEFLRPMD